MTFWPSAWLILMVLGVGAFAVVSVMVIAKGFSELKAILRKLKHESNGRSSRES